MKVLVFLSFISLLAMPASVPVISDINSDKSRIRFLLNRSSEDLSYLNTLENKPPRKLAASFLLDRKESQVRLQKLEADFNKLDVPSSVNQTSQSDAVAQLLSQVSRFSRHLAAYRAYFEANPGGTGERELTVQIFSNREPASGWRIAYAGEIDVPAQFELQSLGYHICQKHAQGQTNTYRQSAEFDKSTIKITVMCGLGYLWVKHPDNCNPYSVAFEIGDHTVSVVQLNAQSKTP